MRTMSTKPNPENAAFAIAKMRKYAKLANDSQQAASNRRSEVKERTRGEVLDGRRNSLGGSPDIIGDKLVISDPTYREHVANNQFYIDLTNMWSGVAMVELKLMELDVQTPDSIRDAHPARAQ